MLIPIIIYKFLQKIIISSINQKMSKANLECSILDPQEEQKEINATKAQDVDLSTQNDNEHYVDECAFTFTGCTNSTTVTLGRYDPQRQHLVVSPGLNLKGRCLNPNCRAKDSKQVSWIRKGFGTFDVGKQRFNNNCRGCNQKIKHNSITSMGFTRCKLDVKGIKIEGDETINFTLLEPLQEKVGKFTYFSDFDQDMSTWGSLYVTVSQL